MAMNSTSQPCNIPPQDDYLPHGHLPHPYYPVEAEVVGYLANTYSVPFLLTTFAGICAMLFLVTGLAANTINPKLSKSDCLTVMWFVLSTCHPLDLSFNANWLFEKILSSHSLIRLVYSWVDTRLL